MGKMKRTISIICFCLGYGFTAYSTLKIVSSQPWNPLLQEASGVNSQVASGPSWHNSDFINMLIELKPGSIRYPGGAIGNYTDWKTGQYMQEDARDPENGPVLGVHKNADSRLVRLNTFRPEELKLAYDATGATPVYMVNMLTDTLGSTLQMLAHCKSLGLPVKYVELGNELYLTYFGGGDIAANIPGDYAAPHHFPTAESYAEECNKWISAIKEHYPEVKIGYLVVFGRSWEKWYTNSPRTLSWNRTMASTITGTDRVIIHHYAKIMYEPNIISGIKSSLDEFNEVERFIADSLPGKKVWFTEYNVKDGMQETNPELPQNPWGGRWGHGILTTMLTCHITSIPQVELACIHNLCADVAVAMITFKAMKIYPCPEDNSSSIICRMEYTAAGIAQKFLKKASFDAVKIKRISFTNNIVLETSSGNLEGVSAYAFENDKGERKLYIVNLTDNSPNIELTDFRELTTVDHLSASSLTEAVLDEVQLIPGKSTVRNNLLSIPRFSISVVY